MPQTQILSLIEVHIRVCVVLIYAAVDARLSILKDQGKRESSPNVRSGSVGRLVGRLDPSTAPKLEFGKEPETKKELHGFDAELRDKIEATWDVAGEKMALAWIASMTGDEIPTGVSFYQALKSGVLLCKTINKVRPNIVANVNYQPFNGLFERVRFGASCTLPSHIFIGEHPTVSHRLRKVGDAYTRSVYCAGPSRSEISPRCAAQRVGMRCDICS